MTITLSHHAQKDLDKIRQYTLDQWGRDQWLKYYRGLVSTFEEITENPEKGRARDLFYPEMRSMNYEKHVVFYKRIRANDNEPVILRIVHQKRNMPALVYYEELDG
jgi:toxin ParE1/3/4